MTTTPQPSELGPYTPVRDALVLAAMDRAQRHNPHGYEVGVGWATLVEHLGFVHNPATTRKLRPQVTQLAAAGLVETSKRRGYHVWRLTSDGRKQLAKARRKREDLELPEAPQHRVWRDARATAARRLDGLREQLRRSVNEATTLLDGEGDSDAYYRLRFRIGPQLERLGAAVYCLREWPEPDDARADVDHDSKYGEWRRNVHMGGG
jgi:DNA-binding PadR family transcriptional regulator